MDPHATLLALLKAIRDRDTADIKPNARDLHAWLLSGGFIPFGIHEAIDAIKAARAKADKPEAETLESIRNAIRAYDDKLDDRANGGANARAPDGDDYNAILSMIGAES